MMQLLTATGCRPQAWSLCERWMKAQTYRGPVRWVIVDDGEEPQPITFERDGWELEVIRPQPFWQPGQNTQARNLLAGLARIDRAGVLVVIEDDDHYSPEWLSIVEKRMKLAELVGEIPSRYFNVATMRGKECGNVHHSSLCSTAMRGAAIDRFAEVCVSSPKFIDLQLWKHHPSRRVFGGTSVTGIKGMPGRAGIGMGHRPHFGINDPGARQLRNWVGRADAEVYLSGMMPAATQRSTGS